MNATKPQRVLIVCDRDELLVHLSMCDGLSAEEESTRTAMRGYEMWNDGLKSATPIFRSKTSYDKLCAVHSDLTAVLPDYVPIDPSKSYLENGDLVMYGVFGPFISEYLGYEVKGLDVVNITHKSTTKELT